LEVLSSTHSQKIGNVSPRTSLVAGIFVPYRDASYSSFVEFDPEVAVGENFGSHFEVGGAVLSG
jgi:hypothetical protein